MKLAVDVDYRDDTAFSAGIAFNHWQDDEPANVYTSRLQDVPAYTPGEFYKRELPCILELLRTHSLNPEILIIDGFVFLDGHTKPGLGKHLYDALSGHSAVIGVAKQPFKGIPDDYRIYRGKSDTPLYVTSAGLANATAKCHVIAMHGQFRIPTLLKKADQVCRAWQRA